MQIDLRDEEIVVHFHGGPFDQKGRIFKQEPSEHLLFPLPTDETLQTGQFSGNFAKYTRASEQVPGRPLVYEYVKTFRGEE